MPSARSSNILQWLCVFRYHSVTSLCHSSAAEICLVIDFNGITKESAINMASATPSPKEPSFVMLRDCLMVAVVCGCRLLQTAVVSLVILTLVDSPQGTRKSTLSSGRHWPEAMTETVKQIPIRSTEILLLFLPILTWRAGSRTHPQSSCLLGQASLDLCLWDLRHCHSKNPSHQNHLDPWGHSHLDYLPS